MEPPKGENLAPPKEMGESPPSGGGGGWSRGPKVGSPRALEFGMKPCFKPPPTPLLLHQRGEPRSTNQRVERWFVDCDPSWTPQGPRSSPLQSEGGAGLDPNQSPPLGVVNHDPRTRVLNGPTRALKPTLCLVTSGAGFCGTRVLAAVRGQFPSLMIHAQSDPHTISSPFRPFYFACRFSRSHRQSLYHAKVIDTLFPQRPKPNSD